MHWTAPPGIHFIHFSDLLADLDGQMRIVAHYLDIEIDETLWPTLVDNATFKRMKANAGQLVAGGGDFLVGGAQRFLHRGTNGRWRNVLSEEELALYEKRAAGQLSRESKQWLEFGASASSYWVGE